VIASYYRVYGLVLGSERPLPELSVVALPSPRPPDVTVRVEPGPATLSELASPFMSQTTPAGNPWLSCTRDGRGYRLRFPDLAEFTVDEHGREIVCRPSPDTALDSVAHLLLDQVLPLVLNLRGREALHAAAVVTPAGACLFTGPSGTGKSTLAACFAAAGHPVLSDDCVALEERDDLVRAMPAYPGLRVWPDTLEALGTDGITTLPVADYTPKRRLVPRRGAPPFPVESKAVSRIYVLQSDTTGEEGDGQVLPGAHLTIEPLSRRDALMALVASAFRLDITDMAMATRQLEFLERVTAQVPVRRLVVPVGLESLPAVRQAVLADTRTC
jgi:energy-coupling factor transporter ATP-binding protein EcfA2